MLILRGEISKHRERKNNFLVSFEQVQRIKELEQDLNSILREWEWGGQPFTTAQQFLKKMKPWIDNQIKVKKELEKFLKKKGVESLKDLE